MATLEAHLVNRMWARDPDGELVQIIGTRRSGMSMEFIVEKDEARKLFQQLYAVLYPDAPAARDIRASCETPVAIIKDPDGFWRLGLASEDGACV